MDQWILEAFLKPMCVDIYSTNVQWNVYLPFIWSPASIYIFGRDSGQRKFVFSLQWELDGDGLKNLNLRG